MAASISSPSTTLKALTAPSAILRPSLQANGTTSEITHGVVIVATGAKEYQPKEYLYGQDDRVMTQRELEQRLAGGNVFSATNGSGRKDRGHDPVRGLARGQSGPTVRACAAPRRSRTL